MKNELANEEDYDVKVYNAEIKKEARVEDVQELDEGL